MPIPNVRDLLYFDFEKASSIWSQFAWGRPERISVSEEESTDHRAGASLGIPKVLEATLGVGGGEKRIVLETKIIHHDLLNRIEAMLNKAGLLVDLNASLPSDVSTPEVIRETIGNTPYIKARGWSVIEDYQRILSITERFNELVAFISRSALESIKEGPEYVQLQQTINAAREEANSISDRNAKAKAKARLKTLEKQLDQMLVAHVSKVDQWILDGIKLWITTFVPNRLNFRVYPFPNCPSFQILCNLKRDSFVDQDLEHLLYGYGNRPNVPLAVFGLVTSIPSKSGDPFDPLLEFSYESGLDERMRFEKAFRELFGSMDGLEAFVRYSRYPNITIHPIAVFRDFEVQGTGG